jgi:hypothetical protein
MTSGRALAELAGAAGVFCAIVAVVYERRMQRHRQPGVSYAQVTFRKDGAWRRTDLFTPEGLAHQAKAARYGMIAAGCWVLALIAWVVSAR